MVSSFGFIFAVLYNQSYSIFLFIIASLILNHILMKLPYTYYQINPFPKQQSLINKENSIPFKNRREIKSFFLKDFYKIKGTFIIFAESYLKYFLMRRQIFQKLYQSRFLLFYHIKLNGLFFAKSIHKIADS